MNIERIIHNGEPFALVPFALLEKLQEDAEMLHDIQAFDAAKARLDAGEDETIPLSIIERRLAGEHPVKIWREHRGLTQEALAAQAGVTRSLLAAIETGNRSGSVRTLRKLALALDVAMEQLMGI
jgi:DNA-binding XRE family transcriptional regulator